MIPRGEGEGVFNRGQGRRAAAKVCTSFPIHKLRRLGLAQSDTHGSAHGRTLQSLSRSCLQFMCTRTTTLHQVHNSRWINVSDLMSVVADSQALPMPSPNVANKGPTAKKTPEKKGNVDLSQKLAKRKSQDFKSKIAAWDAQGQDEVVVVEEESAVDAGGDEIVVMVEPDLDGGQAESVPGTQKPPAKIIQTPIKVAAEVKTSREVDTGRKAWVRRKTKANNEVVAKSEERLLKVEVTPDVKKAVAPKKRVVSDGHWRRDRPPKIASQEKEELKETPPPKPVTVRRSVMTGVGLKFPPSVQDFVEDPDPEPVRRRQLKAPATARSRSRDHERGETPDYESGGTKVYIKRRRRSKEPGGKAFSTSESSLTAGSSFDRPSTATDITTPEDTPTKAKPGRPQSEPRDRTARRSLGKETPGKQSPKDSPQTGEVPRRISRGKAKDEHDVVRPLMISATHKATPNKIPATTTPKPPNTIPKVFSNRIEGWLSGMNEDPFTEASERSLTPEPLDIRRKKSRPVQDEENDYDVHRREDVKSRRSRPSLGPIDSNECSRPASGARTPVEDWVHSTSPDTPTLKRRGARRATHSPIKNWSGRDDSPQLADDRTVTDLPRRSSRRRAVTTTYDRGSSRPLPSRPRAPSIVSEQPTIMEGSVLSRVSDGDEPTHHGNGLKRRLTKHSDLMSVLSLPRDDDQRIKPSRSMRSRRGPSSAANVADIMNEVSADELKYQRELRTMVDGVIPVLLTYVLSKGDTKYHPSSRQSSSHDNPELTRPIVDMGVALERLKTQHKRIPMHDANELLIWAQSSAIVYNDYLQAWRLGFSDVVVNLAPADDSVKRDGSPRWDHDLQRNEKGDMLNGNGERVDVAYLLKRPLVRLKNLSRALKSISQVKSSALADDMAAEYNELVLKAKQRTNDERARLEDEAAAMIDPTRARDPHNLAPLSGVNVDPTRSVRARDYFDMQLYHSSGQQLTCKVELIARDDAPNRGNSGDVLFCEVATNGRWLLFPPVLATRVSARAGEKEGEIVVMVRGISSNSQEWREIMSLQSNDEQSEEWLRMLASDPKPPRLPRQSSFNTLRGPSAGHQRPPSPTESELPIGERAVRGAQTWDGSDVNSSVGEIPPSMPPRARYQGHRPSPLTNELSSIADSESGIDDRSRYGEHPRYRHTRSQSEWTATTDHSTARKGHKVWMPSAHTDVSDESDRSDDGQPRPQRPGMRRRTSSVPSLELPTIRKQRTTMSPDTPRHHERPAEDPLSAPSKLQKRQKTPSKDETPEKKKSSSFGLKSVNVPSFTPAFMKKSRRSSSPLKHEYEPSTATESSSDSDLSDVDEIDSVTSDSYSEEEKDEGVSTVGDLRDFGKFGTVRRTSRPASKSNQSKAPESLGPSDSASQGPYRGVPQQKGAVSAKSLAQILAWSDTGAWQNLHPEECEIVVGPGMIEAFDIAQAHAVAPNSGDVNEPSPSTRGVKPLVALELTPLVPIRRGTAIDISIRSPPTGNSLIRSGNNIMFRSRNPEECEKLYQLINRARIDNPTWIALQHARGPVPTSNWAETMDNRNAERTSGANQSWLKSLSRKSTSYRSKGNRSASIAASQSSVNSMSSAFSALRRFSGGSKIFDIAKSTIHSRKDGGATRSTRTGSDSVSSGAATPVSFDQRMGTPVGVTNSKIRLYYRENASKWQDMGAARLTILLPPRPQTGAAADPRTTGIEKRILVHGKSRGETLLDATLGESCFERIARTGVAVSIWEDAMYAPQTGGVAGAKSKVYMLQMKTVSLASCPRWRRSVVADSMTGTRCCLYFLHGRQAEVLILCYMMMVGTYIRAEAGHSGSLQERIYDSSAALGVSTFGCLLWLACLLRRYHTLAAYAGTSSSILNLAHTVRFTNVSS